ncbi:Rpn family recombination-promoting nuclease/putative transposase [Butyrivibrio sp. WCE2006]|uniref:Rpn family recombination-promoting nuclease/putative transposase n=1 Tax=Butyrivibrio sp. WCE2006 TaxID=1410611 RepID=UPI0005D1A83B|nr:Rpn family recombination-promoting nuclease/putative transposase [Butyrivibrio sp. WCE2006]
MLYEGMASTLEVQYQYMNATGEVRYNMTNDYMFRMVLQRDKNTLINLISSVLDIPIHTIQDVKIENVVEPGASINNKEYQLDILVMLNGNTYINLEMQVINYDNWTERSLSYLCRRFDNVARGKDYSLVKPVYHIGFLDYTLFKDHPEFFAKYQIRNAQDGYLYTDKFNLYVIELDNIDLSSEYDKRLGIDNWARLFKATTWEEIQMIAEDNPSMKSTAESIFLSNSDFAIQEQCRAREDAIAHEKHQKELIDSLTDENKSLTNENKSLSDEIARLSKLLEENNIAH